MLIKSLSPKSLVRASRVARARLGRSLSEYRFYAYLAFLGPGIIAANAGNDASGIATYSTVGAAYGYSLLWTFVPMMISLIVVQEMCVRMGVVTGQGSGRSDPRTVRSQMDRFRDAGADAREHGRDHL